LPTKKLVARARAREASNDGAPLSSTTTRERLHYRSILTPSVARIVPGIMARPVSRYGNGCPAGAASITVVFSFVGRRGAIA
jgi:hypothetical protein